MRPPSHLALAGVEEAWEGAEVGALAAAGSVWASEASFLRPGRTKRFGHSADAGQKHAADSPEAGDLAVAGSGSDDAGTSAG